MIKPQTEQHRFGRKIEKLYAVYLKKVFRKPLLIFTISVLASFTGFLLLLSRPAEFIAPDVISEIEVTADFPPGTPPEEAVPEALRISRALSALPEISLFYGSMGAEADDSARRADPDYRRERLLFRCFLEKKVKADSAIDKIRYTLGDFTKPSISAAYPPERSASILGLSPALTLAVKGSSPDETNNRAETLSANLRREAGSALGSLLMRPTGTRPQLKLIPRREFSTALGVSTSQIASVMYAASEGIISGSMEIEGRPLDIRISGNFSGTDPELLKSLPITLSSTGQQKPSHSFLGALVDIEWVETETALTRQDRSDVIYIDLFPSTGGEKTIRNLTTGREEPGVSRADQSVFVRYRSALAATVVLVLILLYLTLGAQFESLLLPFILLLSVPFSLAGAGPALLLSGSFLDSGSVLGLVALFGISVNSGIVFYEISEEKIRGGYAPARAVFLGALERFRPVLLTTATTIFALLPLVISPLGNSQRSMAATMLGGIIVSSFLAFFAIPPVFIRYFKSKNRRRK